MHRSTRPSRRARRPRDFALWKATNLGATPPRGKARGDAADPAGTSNARHVEAIPGRRVRHSRRRNRPALPTPRERAGPVPRAGWAFARLWVHNAWVTTKGEKTSVARQRPVHWGSPRSTRRSPCWALSTVHHRSAIEWGPDTFPAAHAAWEKFSTFVARAIEAVGEADADEITGTGRPPEAFVAAMDDDLNVAGALAVLHETSPKQRRAGCRDTDGIASRSWFAPCWTCWAWTRPRSSGAARRASTRARPRRASTGVGRAGPAVLEERAQARAAMTGAGPTSCATSPPRAFPSPMGAMAQPERRLIRG